MELQIFHTNKYIRYPFSLFCFVFYWTFRYVDGPAHSGPHVPERLKITKNDRYEVITNFTY